MTSVSYDDSGYDMKDAAPARGQTTYQLKFGDNVVKSFTINGLSTAFGFGRQNNCYSGGYVKMYTIGGDECGKCPSLP